MTKTIYYVTDLYMSICPRGLHVYHNDYQRQAKIHISQYHLNAIYHVCSMVTLYYQVLQSIFSHDALCQFYWYLCVFLNNRDHREFQYNIFLHCFNKMWPLKQPLSSTLHVHCCSCLLFLCHPCGTMHT